MDWFASSNRAFSPFDGVSTTQAPERTELHLPVETPTLFRQGSKGTTPVTLVSGKSYSSGRVLRLRCNRFCGDL